MNNAPSFPESRYPCPCCGHLSFRQPPGSYDICPICFWEDDPTQLRWPYLSGGANKPSLAEAQVTYAAIGVCEEHFHRHVRPPTPEEPRENEWRPIDQDLDCFESNEMPFRLGPTDTSTFYWWRPTFWRRQH